MKEYFKKFTLTVWFIAFGFYWFTPFLVPAGTSDTDTPYVFLATYFYLPGISLPLLVYFCYGRNRSINVLFYALSGWTTYFISMWIFSYERAWEGYPYLASFVGAVLFILISNKFFTRSFKPIMALTGGILSTIGFSFSNLFPDKIGFSLKFFLWTFFVGLVINLILNSNPVSATSNAEDV